MATTDRNKVEFGLSDIVMGTYTVANDGTVTMGTPIHVPGAKSLSFDPEGDESNAYADNIKYWSQYIDNGYTGTLEVMRFSDAVKTGLMGYAAVVGGGLAAIKGATKPACYIAFQSKGDVEKRRGIIYNVSLSAIKRTHSTTEDKIDVETESVDITVTGDNATGSL